MNKGIIKEETKISPNKPDNYTPISLLVERESPGPRRDMLTNSLEKKEINDNGSLQEDGANDDGSSESSSDLLPSTYDIKKMMPYDQRKDPNIKDQPPIDMKRKININYEELEDSGSDGSGDLGREDPNHLASIIEEEEEATEYQRSRSRSKSNSSSPITSNNKILLDNKSKQAKVQNTEKKIPNIIKEETHIKKEAQNKNKPIKEERKAQEKNKNKVSSQVANYSENEIESIINQKSIEHPSLTEEAFKNVNVQTEDLKQAKTDIMKDINTLDQINEVNKSTYDSKEIFDSKSSYVRDKKKSSPDRSRTAKRSESEKAIVYSWNASK